MGHFKLLTIKRGNKKQYLFNDADPGISILTAIQLKSYTEGELFLQLEKSEDPQIRLRAEIELRRRYAAPDIRIPIPTGSDNKEGTSNLSRNTSTTPIVDEKSTVGASSAPAEASITEMSSAPVIPKSLECETKNRPTTASTDSHPSFFKENHYVHEEATVSIPDPPPPYRSPDASGTVEEKTYLKHQLRHASGYASHSRKKMPSHGLIWDLT